MNFLPRILIIAVFFVTIIGAVWFFLELRERQDTEVTSASAEGYAGSRTCRDCHEKFYNLWSPSHHGTAMQPVANVLSGNGLLLPDGPKKVGDRWFEVVLDTSTFFMVEKERPDATAELNRYEAQWALGGRNIYYFLTPFSGGRLQTMPLAYDINRKEWYSNPQSAVRHFVDSNMPDEEIDWKHSLYTFNTTCHSCHVSQLEKNYNLTSNTYHTTWKEPGINCETCHGPSEEHIRVCREAEKRDVIPEDLKIISVKSYTPEQHNSACASCHAKGTPLTQAYVPGEPFFQHFNLMTLEHPDYYPDGRDLGENYTMTTWLQSACAANSDLNCVTCHTSSGRYRYKNRDNDSCAKCHAEQAENFESHTHHKATDSVTCVSCHMPTTEFARMTRSDHSMRPPTPSTTIEFSSPNACNLCHTDQDAAWADKYVREWHGDYQEEVLSLARLIYQGRNGDFRHIDQMLARINDPGTDVIFRNSFIRILMSHPREAHQKYFFEALKDAHPLIRASAAEALGLIINNNTKTALLTALQDSVLVVRNRASTSLASFPKEMFNAEEWQLVENNFEAYEDYLMTYPDTWSAHYNLGSYYQVRGMHQKAVKSYEKAVEFEKEAILPLVNASMAYSYLGNNAAAVEKLKKALSIDPDNSAANLNYGLLLAEMQQFEQSKDHLMRALKSDSTLATAAYNLAVLSAQTNLDEALQYITRAYTQESENPKYGYTFAFYSYQAGNTRQAIDALKQLIRTTPEYLDAYLFLGSIYEENKNIEAAIAIYEQAVRVPGIPEGYRQNIQTRVNMLSK